MSAKTNMVKKMNIEMKKLMKRKRKRKKKIKNYRASKKKLMANENQPKMQSSPNNCV